MVVSALTRRYYLAMTFHCMCRFSLSSTLHLHSPFLPFLYPLCTYTSCPTFSWCFSSISCICQSYHYSSPLSFFLLLYVRTAPLHLFFLSFIPFVLSSPFRLATVFNFSYLFSLISFSLSLPFLQLVMLNIV